MVLFASMAFGSRHSTEAIHRASEAVGSARYSARQMATSGPAQNLFEALRPAANATIAVQNVSLSTFAAASSLAPPDIDPGTLPLATLSATNGTEVPEPGALSVLAAAARRCINLSAATKRLMCAAARFNRRVNSQTPDLNALTPITRE
jgi:hypothetical protein